MSLRGGVAWRGEASRGGGGAAGSLCAERGGGWGSSEPVPMAVGLAGRKKQRWRAKAQCGKRRGPSTGDGGVREEPRRPSGAPTAAQSQTAAGKTDGGGAATVRQSGRWKKS